MKQLRERAGLSQSDLASRIGVSVSAVQKWDQGRAFPEMRLSQWGQLQDVLRCSPAELLEAEEIWRRARGD